MLKSSLILAALLCALLAGCASDEPADTCGCKPPLPPLAEQASSYTTTKAVHAEGSVIGYLLIYDEVPVTSDEPRYTPPGTIFIKDLNFNNVGFISPKGQLYRFGKGDLPEKEVHQSSLLKNLAVFFRIPEKEITIEDV